MNNTNKKKIAHRGEFWSINDNRTRGHKSFIVKGNKYRDYVLHLPITHSDTTRNMYNKRLIDNPQFNKSDYSYILTRIERTHESKLGKKHNDIQIKNTTDKAVVRNIIRNSKNRHKKR